MSRSTVKDTDRGIKRLLKEMQKKRMGIKVGIHGDAGMQGPTSVLQIANWNHDGTSRIPARPFVAQWYDNHILDNMALVYKLFARVVENKGAGGLLGALHLAGLKFVAGIQAEIVGGGFAPNAASTVRRKGSSSPLIDTGVLKASVTYKVSQGAAS